MRLHLTKGHTDIKLCPPAAWISASLVRGCRAGTEQAEIGTNTQGSRAPEWVCCCCDCERRKPAHCQESQEKSFTQWWLNTKTIRRADNDKDPLHTDTWVKQNKTRVSHHLCVISVCVTNFTSTHRNVSEQRQKLSSPVPVCTDTSTNRQLHQNQILNTNQRIPWKSNLKAFWYKNIPTSLLWDEKVSY